MISRTLAGVVLLCMLVVRGDEGHARGFDTITAVDLDAHVRVLAAPGREGRDTPSQGLEEAAAYIAGRLRAAGVARAPDSQAFWQKHGDAPAAGSTIEPDGSTYLRPFRRSLQAPDPARSHLRLAVAGASETTFVHGTDFVPRLGCAGEASGELVFAGFGIESKPDHYDELDGLRLRGRIALILEGEPRHAKRFEGPLISRAASLAEKLDDLREAGTVGVLVVRRPPPPTSVDGATAIEGDVEELPGLAFRHGVAHFLKHGAEAAMPHDPLPVLELSTVCASALLGEDVEALATKIETSLAPARVKTEGRKVSFAAGFGKSEVRADNVVGLIPGTDLADEYVVVGAHYDHLGVDHRGRIAIGADDNASGTAAVLEIAAALVVAKPRRSVLVCAFAGEEHGLLGSRAFCADPPVPKEKLVAMLNMDMIGRGTRDEAIVLGIVQNPTLEKVLTRAKKLAATGVRDVVVRKGEDLFQRSDHYPFHAIGVPVLFFFEGLPITKNPDYHNWTDTIDRLDFDKMLRTTRLVFNTTWLLSNDDEKPPRQ